LTLSANREKAEIRDKGQEWGRKVGQVFTSRQHQEALDILGLFFLTLTFYVETGFNRTTGGSRKS